MNRTALQQLTLAYTREMIRDRRTFFFSTLYPFVLMGLFLGLQALIGHRSGGPDLARLSVPLGFFISMGSLAMFGTAVPLVAMRERGTMRLLATVPISRATVLFALVPARLVIALAQLVALTGLTWALGYVPPGRIPQLLLAATAGLLMLGAFGYLLGGVLPSAEASNTILALGLVCLMFTSGLVVPSEALPDVARHVFDALPTTYLGDLLRHFAIGAPTVHPVWFSSAVLLTTTAAVAALATRTFRWDSGE